MSRWFKQLLYVIIRISICHIWKPWIMFVILDESKWLYGGLGFITIHHTVQNQCHIMKGVTGESGLAPPGSDWRVNAVIKSISEEMLTVFNLLCCYNGLWILRRSVCSSPQHAQCKARSLYQACAKSHLNAEDRKNLNGCFNKPQMLCEREREMSMALTQLPKQQPHVSLSMILFLFPLWT